jgi:predicted dehydrogenase
LAAQAVFDIDARKPEAVGDYRRILDDPNIDILVVATCNHWHAPAAIDACAAGKHVYVEKPCSHNPREGEWLVAAARKYDRRVQMGNQRRSRAGIVAAMGKLREGAIGRVYYARASYQNMRPSIGIGKAVDPPAELNYDLWQGPAPRKPFRDNYLHYNWHWFWHWGNGELGNNGVHMLDVCRWGLGVDHPIRVTSAGGRYHFQDDQETPDTHVVAFDFEDRKSILWEGFSCNGHQGLGVQGDEAEFRGDAGTMVVSRSGYTIYDLEDKVVATGKSGGGEREHLANFVDSIRSGTPLNSEILEGHKSTLMCHLGNIAHRMGRSLACDSKDGRILNDEEAMQLWTREYETGWEPKV